MPSKTILSTNNGPAIATSSFLQLPSDGLLHFEQLPVPNDNSSFKQGSVPHDGPAHFKQTFVPNVDSSFKQISVPRNGPVHFKQTFVPTTTASTGLQAYNDHHSSLNDVTAPQAYSTMTATTTLPMTEVPAITTAITKVIQNKLDVCILHPANMTAHNATLKSLLLHAKIGSAITTTLNMQNLLLPSIQDNSLIMMATHASNSLQLIVKSFSMGSQQVAPAIICNNLFKLIDAWASEGEIFAPYIFQEDWGQKRRLDRHTTNNDTTGTLGGKDPSNIVPTGTLGGKDPSDIIPTGTLGGKDPSNIIPTMLPSGQQL
jgi:hypothetical protein